MIEITYRSNLKVVTAEVTDFLTFSGGEEHVRLTINIDKNSPITITARLTSSEWVMRLFLVTDALLALGAESKDIGLIMPYLPYARQDRVCSPGDAFSLRAFVKLLAAQKYCQVACLDIHNANSANLFYNQGIPLFNQDSGMFTQVVEYPGFTHLVSPDKGASDRASLWYNKMKINNPELKYVHMDKNRDPSTGNITGLSISERGSERPLNLIGATCLIVDDICDGGRTFIEAAKILRKAGASRVELFVSHGIFSKGIDELISPEGLDFIYTTDSICKIRHPKLKVFTL